MQKQTRGVLAAIFSVACLLQVWTVSTSPSAGATTTAAPSCGAPITKSPGVLWKCTFDDEFTANTVDSTKWSAQTTSGSGYHSGPECYEDNPANIGEANGYLRLTALKSTNTFLCKKPIGQFWTRETSGSVMSNYSQLYGMVQIRALFPASTIQGLQSSLWMLPNDGTKYGRWPRSGEIDIVENYSSHSELAIPTVHYLTAGYDPNHTNNYCDITPGVFHTYNLVWTPTTMTFTYDGTVCLVDTLKIGGGLTAPAPFDQPFYLNLTQALGVTRNGFTPRTQLPASTYIDYVRMWK